MEVGEEVKREDLDRSYRLAMSRSPQKSTPYVATKDAKLDRSYQDTMKAQSPYARRILDLDQSLSTKASANLWKSSGGSPMKSRDSPMR